MFIKTFRYRVRAEMVSKYLEVQRAAGAIYLRYGTARIAHLQSQGDPQQWLEVHWYSSRQQYESCEQLTSGNTEIARLWQEFQLTLDPEFPPHVEEFDEHVWSDGS